MRRLYTTQIRDWGGIPIPLAESEQARHFTIDRNAYYRWQADYPDLDVVQELVTMMRWLGKARNKDKRPVRGAVYAMVDNWLRRADERRRG